MEERFWSKVDRRGPDECWVWTAARFEKGYGVFRVGEKHCKAHRVAYELTHGPIPMHRLVLHTCDNPPCCNPAHLWLGSQMDNIHDRDRKGRKVYSRGEEVGTALLTEDDVREIRRILVPQPTQAEVARRYGVNQVTISKIVQGKTWKHVA